MYRVSTLMKNNLRTNIMERLIKIILALLFLLSLLKLPYGYYELVRFLALVGFGVLAYKEYERGHQVQMVIYIALAILFQPLLKISLGRTLWNVVDVVVAVGLLISVFTEKGEKRKRVE